MNGACEVNVLNANWGRELQILDGFATGFVFLFSLTVAYVLLVIVMATFTGLFYGAFKP